MSNENDAKEYRKQIERNLFTPRTEEHYHQSELTDDQVAYALGHEPIQKGKKVLLPGKKPANGKIIARHKGQILTREVARKATERPEYKTTWQPTVEEIFIKETAHVTGLSSHRIQKEFQRVYGTYSTNLVEKVARNKRKAAAFIRQLKPESPETNPNYVREKIARELGVNIKDIYIDPNTGELIVDSALREKMEENENKVKREKRKRKGQKL